MSAVARAEGTSDSSAGSMAERGERRERDARQPGRALGVRVRAVHAPLVVAGVFARLERREACYPPLLLCLGMETTRLCRLEKLLAPCPARPAEV